MKDVLVIDDQEAIRVVIAAALTHAGYTVRQARNGREGILMLLSQKPDLILCDVRMPEMDGHRALAAIRKVPGTAAIPFIFMTGSMTREEFREAMLSGADDYLMKPFSMAELIGAIESRLARHSHVRAEAFEQVEKAREPSRHLFSPQWDPTDLAIPAVA